MNDRTESFGRARARLLAALVGVAAGLSGGAWAQSSQTGGAEQPGGASQGERPPGEGERQVPGTGGEIGEAGEGQPGEAGEGQPDEPLGPPREDQVDVRDDMVRFAAFAEPMRLADLVDMVATILGINVSIDPGLSGEVMFNSEFAVPQDELLELLNTLLEQQGYMITRERTGWYMVRQVASPPVDLGDGLATTRIVRTPNMRPSALRPAIEAQLGIQQIGGQQQGQRLAYLDDVGIIMVTASPETVRGVVEIVRAVIEERDQLEWVRFPLDHIAAGVARDWVVQVVTGQQAQVPDGSPRGRQQQPQQIPGLGGGVVEMLDNISDRLRLDPQGNALLFLGRNDEAGRVERYLGMIDKPSTLEAKRYFTGRSTADIANFARQAGLGEVVQVGEAEVEPQQQMQLRMQRQAMGLAAEEDRQTVGGPVMIVDEYHGTIVYYGTASQHAALARLVDLFDAPSEEVVIETYRLQHANAEEIADLLMAVVQERALQAGGEGGILPQNQPGAAGQQGQQRRSFAGLDPRLEDDPNVILGGLMQDVFITADTGNNQLIVKAPRRQQRELAKLITSIDVLRPQVMLDVKIVSISNTDDFRLAVETQLINASGDPVVQTNFGLTSAGESITDPRVVNPGLGGLTSAVILNDYVPFVLNAIQTVTDAKLISNPTLIVNDNVEGTLDDVREEFFQTRTIGDISESITADSVEAGTRVVVTPRISSGGYLTLEYQIEFSNFIGAGTDFLPPPSQKRIVNSSASIPTDSTMVLGGIVTDETQDTVVKVPFIGDIPLVGLLFRDTSRRRTESLLYIFITPRILNDRNFQGYRLVTEGPRKIADIAPDAPPLEPSMMPIISRRRDLPEAGRRGEPAVELDGSDD